MGECLLLLIDFVHPIPTGVNLPPRSARGWDQGGRLTGRVRGTVAAGRKGLAGSGVINELWFQKQTTAQGGEAGIHGTESCAKNLQVIP